VVGSKPKGPRDLHLTILATVDGPAPSAAAEEEAQQKAAEEAQQGPTVPELAGDQRGRACVAAATSEAGARCPAHGAGGAAEWLPMHACLCLAPVETGT